jgi:hypothetical protein
MVVSKTIPRTSFEERATMYKSVCCALIMGIAALGCSGSGGANRLATTKVTGKVTMGGAPVPGATVTFSPLATGRPPAMGVTDTQGVYILTTYDSGDGAVEGEYKVLVFKAAPSAEPAGPAHDPTGQSRGGAPAHRGPSGGRAGGGGSLLPEKYSSVATTTLAKTVAAGENTIDIEL